LADSVVLHKVFTPTTPAVLTFVEREGVNNLIVNALQTPGKQVVVYGHSGSGKTTLLVNKLTQMYERHITTRCMAGLQFDQLLLDAFDQLEPFYTREVSRESYDAVESGLRAQYLGIKATLAAQHRESTATTDVRVLPPQLTPQTLARLLARPIHERADGEIGAA
jgi:energy-coupling factor transporter ATP-binding protein EcfA2